MLAVAESVSKICFKTNIHMYKGAMESVQHISQFNSLIDWD